MEKQGVSVKGQLIVKNDGKQQLHLRVVDPVTGRIDKYLANINTFPQAKSHSVKINGVDTKVGQVVAAITGYHKGSKNLADVSNQTVKFMPLEVSFTFPEKAAASFSQPAPTNFVAQPAQAATPTNNVGDDEIPF